ncbi:toll/interleukin-1 receptor domain-containing adapter protein isoform X1 [Vulpes lagopus]|nr:toll/interleukin-1 receptor domain-containing adapter protein isoform X1 [Vulpes lagopus]
MALFRPFSWYKFLCVCIFVRVSAFFSVVRKSQLFPAPESDGLVKERSCRPARARPGFWLVCLVSAGCTVRLRFGGRSLHTRRLQRLCGWLFPKVKTESAPFSRFTNAWSHGVSFEPNTMASSTSFPAPRSRSRKPAGKVADWFRQVLSKTSKKLSDSAESTSSDVSQPRSKDNPPPLGLSSAVSPNSPSTHVGASSSSSSGSSGRWSKDYDVCVCHSEEDLVAAQELVSYLEGSAASLRCFLQLRDSTPGGAIVSELCHALSSSHCRVLLITPGFLQDPWCKYQMLQALSEAPGAEGRTIPLMSGLTRAAYPAELRFMYFVDGRGPDGGFHQVKEAVMRYLQTIS